MNTERREQIETLKSLLSRLTAPRDWLSEAEDRRKTAAWLQGMSQVEFETVLIVLQKEDPDPDPDGPGKDAYGEMRRQGPRRTAQTFRMLADDAASGREAATLADLAADVRARLAALEAGETGNPAGITA